MGTRRVAALILAAGHGRRMNSDLPKALHEAAGVPLVAHVVDAVREAGIRDVAVVVGGGDRHFSFLKDRGGVRFVKQKARLGTAHAVLQAGSLFRRFQGDLLVMPADAPCISAGTVKRLIETHRSRGARATVLTAEVSDAAGYGRICRNGRGIIGIREELDASPAERLITEINSGIYVFDAQALFGGLKQVRKNRKKKEFYLTDVIERLVESGGAVESVKADHPHEVLGVNTRRELAGAHQALNHRELERHSKAGVTILDPAQTVIAKGARIGRDTVIHPFTWIDKDVLIGRRCQVGPFAKIRSGSRIADGVVIGSFVEVVRSRIGESTFVKHLSYLGDAAIGKRVNVGAGTVTANFDGRRKHRSVVGDDALLGCNTVLVAPTVVGRRAKTGAGAVVCAGRGVPAGRTAIGIPARVMKPSKVRKRT